jgi:MFS family permease
MQTQSAHRPLAVSEIRSLALASLGGALEFYDFVIFVFFTQAIGQVFFSASLPEWMRQIQTFGIFAAGYLARPLGGIIMAHFGDTRGRKRMFALSVLMMAVPTLLISVLPTYQSAGVAAPLLLLLMRVMQGAAIGGEAPGGWVFVAEHARPGREGFAVGLLTGGLTFGIFLGSLVATGLQMAFTQAQIVGGYWRLPFAIGGVFGFIAMFLRRWLVETPVFEQLRQRAALSRELPLRTVLKRHARAIAASVLTTWTLTAAILVVILMSPALLQNLFKIPPHDAQLANLAGTAALSFSTVAIGALTDRFGLRRVCVPALLFQIASTYLLYLGPTPSTVLPLYVLAGLGAGSVALTPIVLVRAFPPPVRFSGVSFSYNISYAVFGGVTPIFVAWLAQLNPINPAHYIAAVSLVGIAATFMAPIAPLGEELLSPARGVTVEQ